jgi:hypothetical protein
MLSSNTALSAAGDNSLTTVVAPDASDESAKPRETDDPDASGRIGTLSAQFRSVSGQPGGGSSPLIRIFRKESPRTQTGLPGPAHRSVPRLCDEAGAKGDRNGGLIPDAPPSKNRGTPTVTGARARWPRRRGTRGCSSWRCPWSGRQGVGAGRSASCTSSLHLRPDAVRVGPGRYAARELSAPSRRRDLPQARCCRWSGSDIGGGRVIACHVAGDLSCVELVTPRSPPVDIRERQKETALDGR